MPEGEYVRPSLRDVNILYTLCMALFILCGEVIQWITPPALSYEQKMGIVTAAQICFVFIPVIGFIYVKKLSYKHILKLNKVSFLNVLLSFSIIFFAMPVVMLLNFFWLLIIQHFGKLHAPINIHSDNIGMLLFNLLIVAIIPAVFEEFLFRGVILSGYQKIGTFKSILVVSVLFALMHRDLQTFLGTFLLGTLIAYIVYRTNSIFAGMASHFANNSISVILMYFVTKAKDYLLNNFPPEVVKDLQAQTDTGIIAIKPEQIMPTVIALGVMAVVFGALLIGALIIFKETTANIKRENVNVNKENHINIIFQLLPSLLLVGYVYYKQMIT